MVGAAIFGNLDCYAVCRRSFRVHVVLLKFEMEGCWCLSNGILLMHVTGRK